MTMVQLKPETSRIVTFMQKSRRKNPYDILQVAQHAEIEVIEGAYRRLAQKYHPDHNDLPDAKLRMQEINWAYGILSDAAKKDRYIHGAGDQPERRNVPENRNPQWIEPELIYVPHGDFVMGSREGDMLAFDVEKPAHRVHLEEFWISRYPITREAYRLFLLANLQYSPPYGWEGLDFPPGTENHPVTGVSWIYCIAYCRWLAEKTGYPYILPSEAEWEKAAHGDKEQKYPWGSLWDPNRCNNSEAGINHTTDITAYSPHGDSPYGCGDMAGNVWEWTRSIFLDYPYNTLDGREQLQLAVKSEIAVRGGAFNSTSRQVRSTCRDRAYPSYGNRAYGFRVVISPSYMR